MASLGENIAQARRAVGLTQDQAARRLGVMPGTWAHWEQDRHAPTIPMLRRIAELLRTSPADLLRESPIEESN